MMMSQLYFLALKIKQNNFFEYPRIYKGMKIKLLISEENNFYFVRYPKAVNILVMFFIVFGVSGVISLKSSFFPLIDSKFISINAVYPGASPEEIEEGVIYKIEDNLKGIPGIVRSHPHHVKILVV